MSLKQVKPFFTIVFFIVLIIYLYYNAEKIKNLNISINWLTFAISMILYVLYKVGQSLIWYYITIVNQCSISFFKTIESWFMSQLGRYIPGKVFYLGSRLFYYHKEGQSKTKVTYSFVLENILTLITAFMVFAISIPFMSSVLYSMNHFMWILIIIPVLFIITHPKIFSFIANSILVKLKKERISLDIGYITLVKIMIMLIINWLFLGGGFFMLLRSFTELQFDIALFFYLTGGLAFAVVIGMLSIFTPSGLGVREGILVFVIKEVLPSTVAFVGSIISRIWMTIGDFSIALIIYTISKARLSKFTDVTKGVDRK